MKNIAAVLALFAGGIGLSAYHHEFQEQRILPMIYPGYGIAEMTLGAPADSIRSLWRDRKPNEVNKIETQVFDASGNRITEYLVLYRDRGILLICDDQLTVKRIICKSPSLLVKDSGLRIGNFRGDVEKAYRFESPVDVGLFDEGKKSISAEYRLMICYGKGIAFTLVKDRIISITVFQPGKPFTAGDGIPANIAGIMAAGFSWDELFSLKDFNP
ncbi:MAG TPA: hypothetical protein PLX50_00485 [Candidatus Aminicenantes bacterium]|nr:hypothetical protein [Candidatus Aminicenantes bacterium]